MSTAVTHDIRVSARARFEQEASDPRAGNHVHSYRITISNGGNRAVQLMRRHWFIFDSMAEESEVEGPGVVGLTPVIAPGDEYSYVSSCHLRGEFGRMHGTYLMRHVDDDSTFEVEIPVFELRYPLAAN